jgi:hypothetical protein
MRPLSLDVDLRDLPIVPEWQPGDPVKEIPRRAYPPEYTPPPLTRRIPDPLLGRQPFPPEPATRDIDVPILNFDAQNYTGVNPPDTVGDVGPNRSPWPRWARPRPATRASATRWCCTTGWPTAG